MTTPEKTVDFLHKGKSYEGTDYYTIRVKVADRPNRFVGYLTRVRPGGDEWTAFVRRAGGEDHRVITGTLEETKREVQAWLA